MIRPSLAIALILAASLSLGGCVISVRDDGPHDGWSDEDDWQAPQGRNRALISELQLGWSLQAVTAELGTPDRSESFLREGREYRVLLYRTHRTRGDGRTTRDEMTPLVFVDGELVGWGESAVEHAMR